MSEIIEHCYGYAPVYKNKPYEEKGKTKVVHQNLLMPITYDSKRIES